MKEAGLQGRLSMAVRELVSIKEGWFCERGLIGTGVVVGSIECRCRED